jgi:nitroimidazol reductase NimA-like FMN-containing flavoprotein (pyridoxamine 5'-phosphate oxidase superfamily)
MDEATRALTGDECRQRLRPGGEGHVAVTVGALPAIVPVRYELRDGQLWCSTADPVVTPLPRVDGIVAFETDQHADASRPSWSVLVVGPATSLPDGGLRLPTDLVAGCERTSPVLRFEDDSSR